MADKLILLISEEESEFKTSRISMETEIWTWGLNAKGQLGLGDMIERYNFVIQAPC